MPAVHRSAEDPHQPNDGSTPDPETQSILRRLRQKPPKPGFRVLVWDALLGIALGVLVIVVFSQWMTAGVTGR